MTRGRFLFKLIALILGVTGFGGGDNLVSAIRLLRGDRIVTATPQTLLHYFYRDP